MFFTQLTSLLLLALTSIGVSAVPMFDKEIGTPKNVPSSRSIARRSTEAPHFVIYGDARQPDIKGPPPVKDVKGYNVFALSFLLSKGAWDKAAEWQDMSDDERAAIKAEYNDAGISLVVSAFGGTEEPTTMGLDPIEQANAMSSFVRSFGLDGIDVDYEDLTAMNKGDGSAEEWLITFTRQLRGNLPKGDFIVTHAPLAPWFSPDKFGGGAYNKVHAEVGDLIDWYNIQFYNQQEYTDCEGLINTSSSVWPKSSVLEIVEGGVPAEKVVLGKPATADDATNGFVEPAALATCVAKGAAAGWNGGVMVWQYPHADAAWISTVRGDTF